MTPQMWIPPKTSESIQAKLAAESGPLAGPQVVGPVESGPHHPIGCTVGELRLYEDGTFECDHSRAGPDSERTRAALNASAAYLILEMAERL